MLTAVDWKCDLASAHAFTRVQRKVCCTVLNSRLLYNGLGACAPDGASNTSDIIANVLTHTSQSRTTCSYLSSTLVYLESPKTKMQRRMVSGVKFCIVPTNWR